MLENESSNMRNSIGVTFVMIILFSSKALSSKPSEEVDTVKVFEYFGSKIIQIRHIIQTAGPSSHPRCHPLYPTSPLFVSTPAAGSPRADYTVETA